MKQRDRIARFLQADTFAVAGASTQRHKYGNKVLRCYMEHGYTVIPVNPGADAIEGIACVASVAELPSEVEALSVIPPPQVTLEVVKQAIEKGIKHIWMQPGAEEAEAINLCRQQDINIIADGSCLLVELGFSAGH
ncbi:MAG: CoA-binding protein [Desulfuromonadaceae bacterium]